MSPTQDLSAMLDVASTFSQNAPFATDMNAAKMLAAFPLAQKQADLAAKEKRRFNTLVLPLGGNNAVANMIVHWANERDEGEDLSLEELNATKVEPALKLSGTFENLTYIYATAHHMALSDEVRGSKLRDEIKEFLDVGVLDKAAFECGLMHVRFDNGLVNKILRNTVQDTRQLRAREMLFKDTEAFCNQHGYGEQLLEALDHLDRESEARYGRRLEDAEEAEAGTAVYVVTD